MWTVQWVKQTGMGTAAWHWVKAGIHLPDPVITIRRTKHRGLWVYLILRYV